MAGLARLGSGLVRQHGRLLLRRQQAGAGVRAATIATSGRNKDTASVVEQTSLPPPPAAKKNWVSWGFDVNSEAEDNTLMHLTFFFSVTLCLITTGFVWAYLPDYRMYDWAQREAYLQLRKREAEGLPLIDPNLVDSEKIELPSDEELADTEIII